MYKTLNTLDFDLKKEIRELRAAIKPLEQNPETFTFSQSAKEAVRLAVYHSRRTNKRTIGTISLFIGAITSPYLTAATAFADTNNITQDTFDQAMHSILH